LAELQKPSPNLDVLGDWLLYTAIWHAFVGAARILDGEEAGWGHLASALEYHHASLRVSNVPAPLGGVSAPDALRKQDEAVLTLCHALAFERPWIADWLGALLERSLANSAFGSWLEKPFPVFALALWAKSHQRRILAPEGRVADVAVYAPLLDETSSDEAWKNAVAAACDYHLEETKSDDRELRSGSFASGPYDIWPVEILSWQRWVRSIGREPPQVDHPLLKTPLAVLPRPEALRSEPDELLDQVQLAAEKQQQW
jgi:hypothetical protein